MFRYITLCLFSAFLMMAACQKKQDFTNLKELNSVTVETQDSAFVLTQYDVLKIEPVIHGGNPDGAGFTYEWKLYPQSGASPAPQILSTEKNLEAEISVPTGSYFLHLRITDESTGIHSYQQFTVTVNGKFYQGWLVASNKEGNTLLSFIRTDDSLFLNPAETINGTNYPGNALGIYSARNISLMLLFTTQGAYRFNINDFLQNGTTTDLFPGGKSFSSTPAYALNLLNTDQFIVDETGLYVGLGPTFFPGEVLEPYSDRLPGDYALFPAIIRSGQLTTYFYDNKYQRFMQLSYLSRGLSVSPPTTSASFNLANVGKTMIAYDRGSGSFAQEEFYFVMQDDNGRYLYSLNGSTPGLAQQILNSPGINEASGFVTSSILKHMYYAVGKEIYLYDMLANSARLVYTFPDGYQIKDMKMLRSTSRRIVVGADNGSEGEVYYLDLDNVGNVIDNTYSRKFTGFGNIVQLSF